MEFLVDNSVGGMKMVEKIQNAKLLETQHLQAAAVHNVKKVNPQSKENIDKKKNSVNSMFSRKVFDELTKKLDDLKKIVKISFKYEILRKPDMIVLKMVNEENGEVIRQIPPEEAVRLAKAIDALLGLFVDKHV